MEVSGKLWSYHGALTHFESEPNTIGTASGRMIDRLEGPRLSVEAAQTNVSLGTCSHNVTIFAVHSVYYLVVVQFAQERSVIKIRKSRHERPWKPPQRVKQPTIYRHASEQASEIRGCNESGQFDALSNLELKKPVQTNTEEDVD
jgi:hypothetical protein